MMEKIPLQVVVPVYRSVLDGRERASLAQTVRVLGGRPIVLLHPSDVDVGGIAAEFPTLRPLAVSPEWLGTRNGIGGYNRMMLSPAFYDLFADTTYILICHTDAWIFRDELDAWCRRGYDCVAAPWIRRPVYGSPLLSSYLAWRRRRAASRGETLRQSLYGRVGNGGLSLRRVDRFRRACEQYRRVAERYLSEPHHLHNEDVFWALVPRDFRYPTQEEALAFSFDANPASCYRLTAGRLPMGCHSWSKPRMYRFWRQFIPV